MVAPKRSESRRRLCTAEDIQRLPLLKALVDRGHAIGMIAGLNSAQLEERLGIQEQADAGSGSGSVRKRSASCWLLVIGEVLHQQFAQRDFVSGTEMVASYGSLEEADGWSGEPVDVVLIECATLFDETILMVQSLTKRVGALRAVIVYQFTQQGTERKIDQRDQRDQRPACAGRRSRVAGGSPGQCVSRHPGSASIAVGCDRRTYPAKEIHG